MLYRYIVYSCFRTTQHFKNSMATHALIDASIVPLDEGVGHNPVVLFLTPKFWHGFPFPFFLHVDGSVLVAMVADAGGKVDKLFSAQMVLVCFGCVMKLPVVISG